MFRWLAYLFFAVALVTLAADVYVASAGDGILRLHALGEWWARIHRESLLLLQPAVERHLSPGLWDPGIQTVLEWPAAPEFAVLGAVFWLLRRRKPKARESLKFRR
jgi:hypothetical protein